MKDSRKRKILIFLTACIFTVLLFTLFNNYYDNQPKDVTFTIELKGNKVEEYQLYYDTKGDMKWQENESVKGSYTETNKYSKINFIIPRETKNIRLDLGNSSGTIKVREINVKKSKTYIFPINDINENLVEKNDIISEIAENELELNLQSNNSYIVISDIEDVLSEISGKASWITLLIIIASLLLGLISANAIMEFKNSVKFIKNSWDNRKLIMNLSKNDFKNKYASSYLGVVWGFIQPLVTIMVYWFVFQVGFRSGDVGGKKFVLWFIAGIIPWFFFQEVLSSATNAFLEYNYLVKKVVFKIEILPTVKIISSLFVHGFFILFIYIIMGIYGYKPDVYTLQFVYYTFCMIFLLFAISTITSSVILFFRDLGQIIAIAINMGFWFTPIGWQLTMLPDTVARLFKLNPMYYIVTGYRDAFIDKIFFWQRPYETLYFWAFCIIVLCFGAKIFRKLKPHFSDVI